MRTAATAQTFTQDAAGGYSVIAHNVATSAYGTDLQAYTHWMPTPQVAPVLGVCSIINADALINTQFSVAMVGTTPRNYISQVSMMGCGSANTVSTTGLALIYE